MSEEPLNAFAVFVGRRAHGVVDAVVRGVAEILDCPADGPYGVLRTANMQRVEHIGGHDLVPPRGEHDVTMSSLRYTEERDVHDAVVYDVASSSEGFDGDVHDLLGVVLDGRDVFDEDKGRAKDPSRPRHPRVERVSGILPSRVVVEVGVALARRTSDENVDGTHRSSKASLARCQRASILAIDGLLYELRANVGVGEVGSVHGDGVFVDVHSEWDLDPEAATAVPMTPHLAL